MRLSFTFGLLLFMVFWAGCQHVGNDHPKAGPAEEARVPSSQPEDSQRTKGEDQQEAISPPQQAGVPPKVEPPNLKAMKTESGQGFSYRIKEGVGKIDFKEVFVGTKRTSNPVTWVNVGQVIGNIQKIVITGENPNEFSAELIGPSDKAVKPGKDYGQILFIFSPTRAGRHSAIAKLKLGDGNGESDEIRLQGNGVAVLNRGTLLCLDIPGSPKKGLDFGRVRAGSFSERKFKLRNMDATKDIEILRINISPDFAVKKVSVTETLTYNAPVRSFTVPKGATAEITLELKPPPGFEGKEKMFTGAVEFQSKRNADSKDSNMGAALCGIGFHPPEERSSLQCYE